MDKIIPIAILVLFIILTASWLFSRYRMCPPDKILIVFGKVGTWGSPQMLPRRSHLRAAGAPVVQLPGPEPDQH